MKNAFFRFRCLRRPDWLIKMMKVSLAAINKWGAVQIGETPLAALRNVRFSITLSITLLLPKQVKKQGKSVKNDEQEEFEIP